MIFHPVRLAIVAAVCAICGIGGAGAKTAATPSPAASPAPRGALTACPERAAGRPEPVQVCVVAFRER